jgi:hypothetical protein
MHLDGLTHMQIFEVSLQVANGTWFNNIQKGDLKLNSNLNQSYTIEVLLIYCRCYSYTRGVTSIYHSKYGNVGDENRCFTTTNNRGEYRGRAGQYIGPIG